MNSTSEIIAVVVLLIGAVITVRLLLQRRALRLEVVRREVLLLHASKLHAVDQQDMLRSDGTGQVAILCGGSFASSQLPYLLQGYVRASAIGYVGGILSLEPDLGRREVSSAQIPTCFLDRLVHVALDLWPGGMSGRSIFDVLAIKHKWEPEVRQAALKWLEIIRGQTKPALLLVLVSSGGSAALARVAIEAFKDSYPEVPVHLVTILDEKTSARVRFPEIRDYYQHDRLITHMIVVDNRRHPKASDLGISLFFPGMTVASWLKPTSVDLWNVGAYTFPTNGAKVPRFATLSVHAEYLPVSYIPPWRKRLGAVYLTDKAMVEDAAMRSVMRVVESAELQSVALPKATPGVTRVALVAAPIHPQDFAKSIARIDVGLEKWRAERDIDVQVAYANIRAPMNPETTQVPLVVVYLQPLAASAYDLDQLALGRLPIDPEFTGMPEWTYQPNRILEG